MEDIKPVLKLIFEYHQLPLQKDLKSQWLSDLQNYSQAQIQLAWDDWRKNKFNEGKKIYSYDLVKLIVGRTPSPGIIIFQDHSKWNMLPENQNLLTRVNKMKKNMPDLMERLKEIHSPKEKIILCAVALEEPHLINSPVIQNLIKKVDRLKNEFLSPS